MKNLIICALLLTVPYQVVCDYIQNAEAGGSLSLNKVAANWQQAFVQCYNEGAVLASPVTGGLREAMQSIMENNNSSLPYLIGANAQFTTGDYVSIEGVPLSRMPVQDMYQQLVKEHGNCLTMTANILDAVSCTASFPYICFKKNPECGTSDLEYHFEPATGSCYKVHPELRTWNEANSVCISEGGHLVIVNNGAEASIIYSKIPPMKVSWQKDAGWHGVFIGLRDWTGKGLWLTGHGQSTQKLFKTWDAKQPDSIGRSNCVVLNRHLKLDNIGCDLTAPFVCEKDPININCPTKQPIQFKPKPVTSQTYEYVNGVWRPVSQY